MLLFDMDGTLIDSNGVWKNVDREFLARRGIAYTHAYYEGVAHTILPLAAKFTKEYCRLTESCEEIIAEWMEMARDAYAHVTVKPGVRAYLKQCRAEGRRMAVVTSSVPVHCRTAMEKRLPALKAGLESGAMQMLCALPFGGACTQAAMDRLSAEIAQMQPDFLVGMGGGKAIDTCKVLAHETNRPFFTFPTIASTSASCTSLGIVYNPDGSQRE